MPTISSGARPDETGSSPDLHIHLNVSCTNSKAQFAELNSDKLEENS